MCRDPICAIVVSASSLNTDNKIITVHEHRPWLRNLLVYELSVKGLFNRTNRNELFQISPAVTAMKLTLLAKKFFSSYRFMKKTGRIFCYTKQYHVIDAHIQKFTGYMAQKPFSQAESLIFPQNIDLI